MSAASGLIALAVGLVVGLSTVGPGIGMGISSSKALEGIARQPEMVADLRTTMIIALAFMEALTIYGLLIGFMLIGKIG
jgi:F-type H+-transporting ATPase subunit c